MKGCRVYGLKNNKVVVCRNVKFYEHIFPFEPDNDVSTESVSHPFKDSETQECINLQDTNVIGNSRPKRQHRQPAYLQEITVLYYSQVQSQTLTLYILFLIFCLVVLYLRIKRHIPQHLVQKVNLKPMPLLLKIKTGKWP